MLCSLWSVSDATDTAYDVDPDTGFRMERYRAPVPVDFPGGQTLDLESALELHTSGRAHFIDVYPPRGMGADPFDGTWLNSETHDTLPGASWLPEVGRGFIEAEHQDYLQRNLRRLTNGDLAAPVVFFCTADCWQSWNAAKRVAQLGYTNVKWFPLGTDGWREAGRTLVRAWPVNFIDDSLPPEATAMPEQASFPSTADIFLIAQDGNELHIGSVAFDSTSTDDASSRYSVSVNMDGAGFTDHFLSMRPFRCLEDVQEWYCHLPYPYEIDATVSTDDLTDLSYHLLFIRKEPGEFGIDAWNGVYYALETDASGDIHGKALEGDLNVLAEPPAPGSRPIDLAEFIDDGSDTRRFPTMIIRP